MAEKKSKYLYLLDVAHSRGAKASLHLIQVAVEVRTLDTNSLRSLLRLTQLGQKERSVVMSKQSRPQLRNLMLCGPSAINDTEHPISTDEHCY